MIKKQQGFTLVELMVAIVLALFLAIVAGQSYLSTKTTYRATEQNARIQENLRFATHFINREIRHAGNIGCFQKIYSHLDGNNNNVDNTIRGLFDPRNAVNVYRFETGSGVGGDDFDLSSNFAYDVPNGNAGNWDDAAGRTRPALNALSNQVMRGSDIIAITKISEPLGIRLSDLNLRNNNVLNIAELNGNEIETGQVLLVGDCNAADLFVHTGGDLAGAAGNIVRGTGNLRVSNSAPSGNIWQKHWGSNAEVRFIESSLFFIGQGASDLPALFRLDLGTGIGPAGNPTQAIEIVDGIEIMRALVGVDTDADKNLDTLLRADEIGAGNIANARAIQVGLLAVGTQNTDLEDANNRTFQLTQRHTITSPDKIPDEFSPAQSSRDDTRYRQPSTTTIELRNAGLNRKPEVVDFL